MKVLILSFCRSALVLIFSLAVSQLPLSPAYAEENITITTYYPSPSGSYLDLNVQGTVLVGTGIQASGVSPRIEFTHNTSSAHRHWNIDQASSDTNNPELRFFTQTNNNTGTEENRLIINNDNMILIGTPNNGNFILKANSNDVNNAGDILFESSTTPATQKGRIWTEYNTANSGLYLSSSSTTPDIAIDPDGDVGIGTTSPSAKLDVSGGISASAGIKIGSVSSTCNSSRAGTMRYNSGVMEFCDGSSWSTIGGSLDYRIVGRSTTYKKCCGGTITATCPSSYNRAIGGACSCGGDSPGGGRINSNNFVCSCERASGSGCTTGYAQVVCVK